ncbi:MAG: crotonase/enoyl-CoA hydratase family protein [Proteobacteria bacterium]|nr:crotonase/enoyl-CoA hydratase family protein [Pseudomonadota bacterium]MDA1286218.1 crotonase/enoyl-CoA hydratase family protein [Pseudomonadota bacterium]
MTIKVAVENRITTISIHRPEARNAVDPATATALFKAFLAFEADGQSDVAILTGDATAFCAGFDLKAAALGMTPDWLAALAIPKGWIDPAANPLPSPMGPARLMLSKPVIAAIEGPALAGGLELALWCDVRIVGRSAYFGVFCRRWGVPLIDGGTVRLGRVVGEGRANDLILSGRAVDASEALAIGLANQVVDDGTALHAAQDYAMQLLKFPQGCMRSDRKSARMAPKVMAKALRREWASAGVILGESLRGAARFASGKGRGGSFGDI